MLQLLAHTHTLLLRQRKPERAALDALPQVAAAASELLREGSEEAGAAAARAAVAVGVLLSAAPADRARCSARAMLRLLGALAGAEAQLLQPLHDALTGVVGDWAALRRTCQPLPGNHDSDEESDSDGEHDADRAATWLGAGHLAHAWLIDEPVAGRGDALVGASPLVLQLLEGAAGARSAGCRIAQVLASRLKHAGGCGDETALSSLMDGLCAVLGSPEGADATALTEAHGALTSLLDAMTPWTRLRLLRASLQPPGAATPPAGAVEALLFSRLKEEAVRGWGRPPFGGPVAAQVTVAWLGACAQRADDGDWLACSADAVVGALNALRYSLLRVSAEPATDGTLLASLSQLTFLAPLAEAAERQAAAALAEGDVPRMLALQTLHLVAHSTADAARASALRASSV